jgi:hypothetical protein
MSTAPQAHALAFAAFALVLALADASAARTRHALRGAAWVRLGWATGAAGLIYLVHLPCLIFFWLGGWPGRRRGRWRWLGPAVASLIALVLVAAWERFAGSLLGLSFSGGNNDLAGEALRGWVVAVRTGPAKVVSQVQHSSARGLLVGAFYYPWWLLAVCGLLTSSAAARRWAIAVMVAAALPAVAFTTRFNLPRVAYFMYPAMYPAAAAGIEWLSVQAGRAMPDVRWAGSAALAVCIVTLIALTNADLFGVDQLALWFHYAQGTQW